MQVAAKPLAEVFEALSTALDELDTHGEAMAALHLAMAVECLAHRLEDDVLQAPLKPRPVLRLIKND
jgi:hypothetical protein